MTNGERIEISLITGFLGSGKTTLMRHLLRSPAMKDAAVIVNEFGEVGLDHQLMDASGQEVDVLESGCICCSLDGSLVETIENLLRQRRKGTVPSFRRILVETTGLADPGPVIHELFDIGAVRLGVNLDRVITLVDAVSGFATLDKHEVAIRQAALASSILVSKTDLAKPDNAARLLERLAAINPRATQRPFSMARSILSRCSRISRMRARRFTGWRGSRMRMAGIHHGHSHHDRVSTLALRLERADIAVGIQRMAQSNDRRLWRRSAAHQGHPQR